jgi:predicted amidophosphoribosyltransferase
MDWSGLLQAVQAAQPGQEGASTMSTDVADQQGECRQCGKTLDDPEQVVCEECVSEGDARGPSDAASWDRKAGPRDEAEEQTT